MLVFLYGWKNKNPLQVVWAACRGFFVGECDLLFLLLFDSKQVP